LGSHHDQVSAVWHRAPKQPYYIHLKDNQQFAFAGIWESWKPADADEAIDTFAILTTTPNKLMSELHYRMPVILTPDVFDRWLSNGDPALFKSFPSEQMEAHPVSTLVNKPENESQECMTRLADAQQIPQLFS